MTVRSFVTFQADFPDDAKWDESGNLIVPGGRAILSCISSALERNGITCSDPKQHSFYGWEFDADCREVRVWCLIQAKWLFLTKARRSLADVVLWRKHEEEHREFLKVVHAVLHGDPRFGVVRWFTRQEYESFPTVGVNNWCQFFFLLALR